MKHKIGKIIIAAIIALVVGVICVLVLRENTGNNSFLKQVNKNSKYAFYLKDKEIYITDQLDDDMSVQLTTNLIDIENIENETLETCQSIFTEGIYLGEKYVIFPDKIYEDDEGFNLYYKRLSDLNGDAIKIDVDISQYIVDEKNERIIYIRGKDEGSLYEYKIEEEVKEKITEDVESIEYIMEDFTAIYYKKEDSLYKWNFNEREKEKILSDIADVIKIYDDGKVYYTRSNTEQVPIMNFIEDDLLEQDKKMTYPQVKEYPAYPESPYSSDYDSYYEYERAYDEYLVKKEKYEEKCEKIDKEYEEALDKYREYVERQELRADLNNKKIDRTIYSLNYFNGEEKVICDSAMANYYQYNVANSSPVLSYLKYDLKSFEDIKISEIQDVEDAEFLVDSSLYSTKIIKRYIAAGEKSSLVGDEIKISDFCLNKLGTIAYYTELASTEKGYGDLYTIQIEQGNIGPAKSYDSDVCTQASGYIDENTCFIENKFINDTDFLYFKEVRNGTADMYVNKEKIDTDVSLNNSNLPTYNEQGTLYYIKDWNDKKKYGALKCYNGETMHIEDDVYNCTVQTDGRVMYLYDYSIKSNKGELYQWYEEEKKKIDDDVVCFMPTTNKDHIHKWLVDIYPLGQKESLEYD